MHIALLGPSGSGKGSHAANLATRFDLLHVVSGELFRANLEKRTAVGLLARRYMAQGELVPDEVVDAMMEEAVLQITRRYNLNRSQEEYTRLLLVKRTKQVLDQYEPQVRELLKEQIDIRLDPKRATMLMAQSKIPIVREYITRRMASSPTTKPTTDGK